MALASGVHVSDEEKLQILRRLDQFRHWHSLDDKRYCLVCGKIITGHQIQLMGGTRGNGPLRMICPMEGCHSIPMDWVLPTDEILAKVEMMAGEERKAPVSSSADRGGSGHRIASSAQIRSPSQASFLKA
ncbi:MAG: hypothetical protein DME54_01015 [Verrucomicrobia bacterium]|nr:MAG: hypothetical protein DME62_07780 [Verrucomicrobiota bacterium]PYK36413.1 MAG: hypothetical protein DME54_01015 [Verrucomicrobiota bacterium]